MAKVNKQGPQKKVANTNIPKATEAKKPATAPVQSRQSGKSNRPRVGGTATPGAKSTQPREVNTTNPQQQQAESYNRTMRRRMEHLGTGPTKGKSASRKERSALRSAGRL